jgi:hypothetical protein
MSTRPFCTARCSAPSPSVCADAEKPPGHTRTPAANSALGGPTLAQPYAIDEVDVCLEAHQRFDHLYGAVAGSQAENTAAGLCAARVGREFLGSSKPWSPSARSPGLSTAAAHRSIDVHALRHEPLDLAHAVEALGHHELGQLRERTSQSRGHGRPPHVRCNSLRARGALARREGARAQNVSIVVRTLRCMSVRLSRTTGWSRRTAPGAMLTSAMVAESVTVWPLARTPFCVDTCTRHPRNRDITTRAPSEERSA